MGLEAAAKFQTGELGPGVFLHGMERLCLDLCQSDEVSWEREGTGKRLHIILSSLNCTINLLDRKWGSWGVGYHHPQPGSAEAPALKTGWEGIHRGLRRGTLVGAQSCLGQLGHTCFWTY